MKRTNGHQDVRQLYLEASNLECSLIQRSASIWSCPLLPELGFERTVWRTLLAISMLHDCFLLSEEPMSFRR